MKTVEKVNGVHSEEHYKMDPTKTTAERYSEFCGIDGNTHVGNQKTIEVKSKAKRLE
jgi:hypothetical protein